MRVGITLLVLALVFVAGCSGGPEARKAKRYAEHQLCPQQRPEVCTMEYMPVCALLQNGRRKEYASACSACSDTDVVSYEPDACP
jgi:hypothetical protein